MKSSPRHGHRTCALSLLAVLILSSPRAALADPPAPQAPSQPLAATNAKTYRIHIVIPSEVGSRRRVLMRLTQQYESTVRRGEGVIHHDVTENAIDVLATIEVLEVDRNGFETRLRITIDHAAQTPKGEAAREILPQGSIVIAESTPRGTEFRPEPPGKKLPKLAAELLPEIFSTARPGDVSDEDIFGRADPQPLGARWQADKNKLLAKLHTFDAQLKPQEVEGTAQLVNIAKIDGREHLDIVVEIEAQSHNPVNAPADTTTLGASLKISGAVRYPADYNTGWVAWKQQLELEGRFQGQVGSSNEGLTISYRSVGSRQSRATHLDSKK